jgi:isopenicillin-N N-acyltransferase-like protein
MNDLRSRRWKRSARRLILAAALLISMLLVAHAIIGLGTAIPAPPVKLPPAEAVRTWTRVRQGLRVVHLEGTPEAIGSAHARLLRDRMVANETQLWSDFQRFVPWSMARAGILDFSRLRYRHIDRGIPEARQREIAAEALAFQPDPFDEHMPTYQRMLFLYGLYDIALPLEHSPLIGCTTFAVDASKTADGHVLAARAFDFEAGDVFDRDKAVFLVREDGAIPFASVAWPGYVGVVTGMNAEGVIVVVHGGRAGEPSSEGMPVAFSLREALERARDTDEAVAVLRAQRVMVSHIVFVADARGEFAVVERAPGVPAFVRRTRETVGVTNHFEGPLATDPKNERVRRTTSTVARRARLDELLAAIAPHSATPASALAILRDHSCASDSCSLGDRRTIDALIATHGIVADATDRILWVGVGPHLSGAFVGLDLRALLGPLPDPDGDFEPPTMPEDPILHTREYEEGRARAGGPRIGGDRR